MLSLRLIIDTNVLISAALQPTGLQRMFSWSPFPNRRTLYVSLPILEEYGEVLSRAELRIRRGSRQQLLQLIKNHNDSVFPARRITVTSDPDDNIFLIFLANAARADYLVKGNQKHFPKFWKKTKIRTPREFIGLIAPHRIK
jgi:putative PIN family toxin of toxin-antitoxin system